MMMSERREVDEVEDAELWGMGYVAGERETEVRRWAMTEAARRGANGGRKGT
jgi:hypothetical protein